MYIIYICSLFRISSYGWVIWFCCIFPLTCPSVLFLGRFVYSDNLYRSFGCIICIISFLPSYKTLSWMHLHLQIQYTDINYAVVENSCLSHPASVFLPIVSPEDRTDSASKPRVLNTVRWTQHRKQIQWRPDYPT